MIVTLFLYKGLNLYSVFANVNNNGNANNNNASVVGGGVAPDFVKVLYADIFVNSLTKGDFFPPHAVNLVLMLLSGRFRALIVIILITILILIIAKKQDSFFI